jgi:hypothetical protein
MRFFYFARRAKVRRPKNGATVVVAPKWAFRSERMAPKSKPASSQKPVATSTKSTAVATTTKSGGSNLVVADEAFGRVAGAGLQKVTAKDLIIPRLVILQKLSPQLDKKKAEYVEGAEPGDICDVSTGETWKAPIIFLPVMFAKHWLEWWPRATGKGLAAIHDSDAILDKCTRDEKNRPFLNGNRIAETAQFFGFNVTGGMRPCFIPMASTQLKKSKKWLQLATSEKLQRADQSEYTPPLFYRSYLLNMVEESNNDGEWIGWKVDRHLTLPELRPQDWKAVFDKACEFEQQIARGDARADVAEEEEAAGGSGGGTGDNARM